MTKFNVQTGSKFTVSNPADYRYKRSYTVIGFQADKFGGVFCVCEWNEEKGSIKSSHIFFASDFQ